MASDLDEQFRAKILRSLETVWAWDNEENLSTIQTIRKTLPFDDLCDPDDINVTTGGDGDECHFASPEARFVQRLARHFQRNIMEWVNAPKCAFCGNTDNKQMKCNDTRPAQTPEEMKGDASRVEVWQCQICETQTNFPRYNSCSTLLDKRCGRCGEYANLFGIYCRAVGLETRYVIDWTDHVWTEVFIEGNWMMVDSCEGVVDEPSMYEAGWGKKLNYVVAIGNYSVVDVTPRYTRQFKSADFQQRRRTISISETKSDSILNEFNQKLTSGSLKPKISKSAQLSEKLLQQLRNERIPDETQNLNQMKGLTSWQDEQYSKGRISGSTDWKAMRNESGAMARQSEPSSTVSRTSLDLPCWESFYCPPPQSNSASITIDPQAFDLRMTICLNQTVPCCAASSYRNQKDLLNSHIAVAVFLPPPSVCLWQSKVFGQISDLAHFIGKLPSAGVIVCMIGSFQSDGENSHQSVDSEDIILESFRRLGGLPGVGVLTKEKGDKSIMMFLGQVDSHPSWAKCERNSMLKPYQVEIDDTAKHSSDTESDSICWAELKETRPASIAGRLPTDCKSFTDFLDAEDDNVLGFTKMNPLGGQDHRSVYLLNESAYPFEYDPNWSTFVRLPKAIVPSARRVLDIGSFVKLPDTTDRSSTSAAWQVPVDIDFFHSSIGTELILPRESNKHVSTVDVLENKRLVGLYFSAHWCGPCRQFTPILSEAYEIWNESHPVHGLEIIFVSSDRDSRSFESYHRSMPWPAIHFDNLPRFKQLLSSRYGVRGIPSLVILDAVSGDVVATASSTRQEIGVAVRQGEVGLGRLIEDWLNRVPASTIELIQMLQASCEDTTFETAGSTSDAEVSSPMEPQEEIDSSALRMLQSPAPAPSATLSKGPHDRFLKVVPDPEGSLGANRSLEAKCLSRIQQAHMKTILTTTLKYIENCRKSPWVVKFRHFRVSNKVVDNGITQYIHALTLLQSWGLIVYFQHHDYMISVPVGLNLDDLVEELKAYEENS